MIKIIIIDNHQIIREGLKMVMKDEPDLRIVAEAQNWTELLQKIQKNNCDVLLLDMDMPGKKGTELINELKKIKPKTHILALSLTLEPKHAISFLKAGASGFLCKNSASEELVTAIRKINTHGRFLSENMIDMLASDVMPSKSTLPHEQLSSRELETMYMLVSGKRVKDIADELELSVSTIFTYRGRIFEKLDVRSNLELMHYALNNELVEMKSVLS